jgi:hypothetical protein
MKLVFRPFGVGIEDIDTREVRAHAVKVWARTKELSIPLLRSAAEVSTRYTTNGLTFLGDRLLDASKALADVHDSIPQLSAEDSSIERLDKLIAEVKARKEQS